MSKKSPTPALPKELRSPMSKTLPLTEDVILSYTPPPTLTKASTYPEPSQPSPTNNESLPDLAEHTTASQASVYPAPSQPSPTNNESLAGVPEHTASKSNTANLGTDLAPQISTRRGDVGAGLAPAQYAST